MNARPGHVHGHTRPDYVHLIQGVALKASGRYLCRSFQQPYAIGKVLIMFVHRQYISIALNRVRVVRCKSDTTEYRRVSTRSLFKSGNATPAATSSLCSLPASLSYFRGAGSYTPHVDRKNHLRESITFARVVY